MSDAEFLQLTAALVAVIASVICAVESRILRRLRKAGAKSAEAAVTLSCRRPLSRWILASLVKSGAGVLTESGQFYLEQKAYSALRKKRLAIALPVVLAILITAWVLGVLLFG